MRHRLVMYYSKSGNSLGRWFPVDEPNPDHFEVDGEKYSIREDDLSRRVSSRRNTGIIMDEAPHISHSAPRWHGVKAGRGRGFWEQYDKDGRPVITSRRAYNEAGRRGADVGENIGRARDMDD